MHAFATPWPSLLLQGNSDNCGHGLLSAQLCSAFLSYLLSHLLLMCCISSSSPIPKVLEGMDLGFSETTLNPGRNSSGSRGV